MFEAPEMFALMGLYSHHLTRLLCKRTQRDASAASAAVPYDGPELTGIAAYTTLVTQEACIVTIGQIIIDKRYAAVRSDVSVAIIRAIVESERNTCDIVRVYASPNSPKDKYAEMGFVQSDEEPLYMDLIVSPIGKNPGDPQSEHYLRATYGPSIATTSSYVPSNRVASINSLYVTRDNLTCKQVDCVTWWAAVHLTDDTECSIRTARALIDYIINGDDYAMMYSVPRDPSLPPIKSPFIKPKITTYTPVALILPISTPCDDGRVNIRVDGIFTNDSADGQRAAQLFIETVMRWANLHIIEVKCEDAWVRAICVDLGFISCDGSDDSRYMVWTTPSDRTQ